MTLFVRKDFIMHSGEQSSYKIECDGLTFDDLKTLCYLISQKYSFYDVYGVPTGATKIENELRQYCDPNSDTFLVVDDVLTTGASMIDGYAEVVGRGAKNIQGVVLFARGRNELDWVDCLFTMWEN